MNGTEIIKEHKCTVTTGEFDGRPRMSSGDEMMANHSFSKSLFKVNICG